MADTPLSVLVASGTVVSSPFRIAPTDAGLAIEAPSSLGTTLRVQFAPSLAAASASFGTLTRFDGSGAAFLVSSGGASWGLVDLPPVPFARLALGAAATSPLSFGVYQRAV